MFHKTEPIHVNMKYVSWHKEIPCFFYQNLLLCVKVTYKHVHNYTIPSQDDMKKMFASA